MFGNGRALAQGPPGRGKSARLEAASVFSRQRSWPAGCQETLACQMPPRPAQPASPGCPGHSNMCDVPFLEDGSAGPGPSERSRALPAVRGWHELGECGLLGGPSASHPEFIPVSSLAVLPLLSLSCISCPRPSPRSTHWGLVGLPCQH